MNIPFLNTHVHYTVSGKGPVILWLHGFLESKDIWKRQRLFFDANFTNVCIDLLGHGKTGYTSEVHSMELQAQAVLTILNHLNIDKLSIIGHSMGGYIGLTLLEKLGSRVTHFTLMNSTSNPDTEEKKVTRDRAIKVIKQQKDSFVRMGIINLFSSPNRDYFSKAIENLITVAQAMEAKSITAALQGMKVRSSKYDILKKFEGNKLIISGKDDPIISSNSSELEAKNTESKFLKLKGGHMSYLEAYENSSKLLMKFLLEE